MNARTIHRPSRVVALLFAALILVAGCGKSDATSQAKPAENGPRVEIIALDHRPMRPIVAEIDALLDPVRDRVAVHRYDAESDDGKKLAEANGLTGHVAILVLINGKPDVTLGERTVRFTGFPRGKAPMKSAEGDWTMEDLRAALDQELAKR
ncbi:hypothetical protein [Actinokineospora xionganensis]|uniref:Lipoprotein n=1 Tax=Actinokineospora xionganensis TaxID=2684470 RepID=A0ABR7KZZ8_9PSEU|nr:hypothetical protein [Actinokineospora xionganensis]MBC6445950.1 hypothetical protein [Actinokineospora xionganensis]